MKVLMLGWELPPHNSGGLGVACLQLCRALAASQADIDFILPYVKEGHDYDFMRVTAAYPASSKAGALYPVGAYDSLRFLNNGFWAGLGADGQMHSFADAVGRLAQSMEFDVIHAHDWLTFRAAIRVKQTSGKPLIVHVHSLERDRAGGQPGNPLIREIEATTMLLADKIIAVSRRTAQMIADDYDIPLDKIEVIHNSIDPQDLAALEPDNAYRYLSEMKNYGWKVVVNIGRLTIQKGLPHLLRAAAETIKRCPKTLFLIVGDGDMRDELIELSAELGIADKVLFAGFQRGKRWRDAYAIADLFVMPSVSEPFGITPLEAMGYGSPVLISKQSGVSEAIRSCLRVDFWDTDEMANQITGVIKNAGLHDSLAADGYQEYGNLGWGPASRRLMEVYAAQTRQVVGA